MKAWLMKMGLWRLVSGKEKKPSIDKDGSLEKWEIKAERAAAEIYLAVENDQRVHFRGNEEDPIQMWSKLESAHLQQKPGARFNAYDELFTIRKSDDESLLDLGMRIEKCMGTIQNLRPKDFTIDKLDDELQCMALIRALPDEFSHLTANLLLMDKLDKDKILQVFRSEELNRQRRAAGEAVNQVRGQGQGQSKQPYYQGKKFLKGVNCHTCGKEGHVKYNCPDKKGGPGGGNNANSAQKAEETKQSKAENVTESAGNASAFFEYEAYSTSANNVIDWNTDTGATSHMTPHRHWFTTYTPYVVGIRLADQRVIYSKGIGNVVFKPIINGKPSRYVEFTRVLHVPALRNNLLAVLYLTRHKSFHVSIIFDTMSFSRDKETLFTATVTENNVGYLNGTTIVSDEHAHSTSTLPADLSLWHRRLSHHHYDGIKRLMNYDLVNGLKLDSLAKPDPICEPCLAGKMHANPFPSSDTRATELLELIHTDVHQVGATSPSGFKYWITFIDDHSRFRAVIPMRAKSEAFGAFKRFKAWAENMLELKIKWLRIDKGGEYMSNEFEEFLDSCGIKRQFTTRNRPQQNGVAERTNRTLDERITAMLEESGLPKSFWAECMSALVHTWNCCPTSAVPKVTPYQLWYKRKPDVSHLRVWGCVAYVHIQKDKRAKLGSHMEKCIFIGYPEGYKGWKFYNPETRKAVISERADFDERYTFKTWKTAPSHIVTPNPPPSTDHNYTPGYGTVEEVDENESDDAPPDTPNSPAIQPPILQNEQQHPDPNDDEDDEETSVQEEDDRPLALRRPIRNRQPPGEWWKVRQTPPVLSSDSESDDDGSDGEEEEAFVVNHSEPSTYAQAMARPDSHQWKDAMDVEMNAHLENGTWTITLLPPGQKAIGSKWVYKIKHHADGTVERYKGRIVAKGYNQRPGFDFLETFASTMRLPTIRIVLALAAIEDLDLRSVDISHAFINGDIDAEIYMKQPEGYEQGGPNHVCKLNKSLYGLKQSARLWSEKLAGAMAQMGFKRLYSDASIYIYARDGIKVIVPIFVDDITLASKSQKALDMFVVELSKHFKLRDLGPTTFLLGIEISRDRERQRISLSQKQYILTKLEEFNMSECHPIGTPMVPGLRLSSDDSPKTQKEAEEMKKVPYINAVGSLMYLAITTRPDISYTVGVLTRFNSNPGQKHWQAVKHLFRYLKGTIDMKLVYGPDPMTSDLFTTYCDADHGGNKDNGKSTTGYMVKLGLGAVCWSSKLQPVVALSTTEAEYVAAVAAGKEICWMRNLLQELGYTSSHPSPLWIDNQSCITVAKNPEHHGRMKHLDLCFYWLRDKVEKKVITPAHVPTEDMPADLLTKPLAKPKVEKFRMLMGLMMNT